MAPHDSASIQTQQGRNQMNCTRCNESTCTVCPECDEPSCGFCECYELFTTCQTCNALTVPIIEDMALDTCAACTPEEYITHLCKRKECSGRIDVPYSNIYRACPECKTVQYLEDHENQTPAMMYDGTCSKCGDYARDCICGQ